MSWLDFAKLIDQGFSDVDGWQNAIQANPNAPQDALKVAIMARVVEPHDAMAMERFCGLVVELALRCIDFSVSNKHKSMCHVANGHDCPKCGQRGILPEGCYYCPACGASIIWDD